MISILNWRALLGAVLLGLGGTAMAGQLPAEDPNTVLTRHLRILAEEPRALLSLIGAGDAALVLGDAQAAATFFARAEEVAPRDGRVKAALGRAFVQLEQPQAALRFFAEASSLGAPERSFAGDRGLAHDMLGDPRRAQRDYQLVLAGGDDAEVRRRLALSLAISGERETALKAIDGQLRTQDRAAWRTRAFVLALTGDPAQAAQGADQAMPGTGAALRPFFARLGGLDAAGRAMAVHFGRFPTNAPLAPVQMAQAGPAPVPAPVLKRPLPAGRSDNAQPGFSSMGNRAPPARTTRATVTPPPRLPAAAKAETAGRGTSRIRSFGPFGRDQGSATAATKPTTQPASQGGRPVEVAEATRRAAPPPAATPLTPATTAPVAVSAPAAAKGSSTLPPALIRTVSNLAAPTFATTLAAPPPAPGLAVETRTTAARPGFADLAAAIAALSEAESPATKPIMLAQAAPAAVPLKPARARAPPPPENKLGPAPAKTSAKKTPPPPKAPSRHWVQIAGGASKADLGREFIRLKGKAPKVFGTRGGWTTPLRATNRLLVGPFKSDTEAQAFVNDLAKAELSAFSWTSPEGQEIEKLPTA